MSTRALEAVLVREAKIRATNWTFIFWDLLYPLGYLLVFGLGMNASLGFTSELTGLDYNAFFLALIFSLMILKNRLRSFSPTSLIRVDFLIMF